MKRTQRGITLLGFLMVLVVGGIFAYMAMRIVPMYIEYFAVKDAANGLADESGITEMDAMKIRDLFFRRLDVSYAESVEPQDVKITRKDAGFVLNVEYEVRRPLVSNLDIVGHFEVTKEIARGRGD